MRSTFSSPFSHFNIFFVCFFLLDSRNHQRGGEYSWLLMVRPFALHFLFFSFFCWFFFVFAHPVGRDSPRYRTSFLSGRRLKRKFLFLGRNTWVETNLGEKGSLEILFGWDVRKHAPTTCNSTNRKEQRNVTRGERTKEVYMYWR